MRLYVLLRAAFLFLFACTPVFASPLTVSLSGTFRSGTPTTSYSASGGTFNITFLVDSNPAVFLVNQNYGFHPIISAATYTLNGTPVVVTPDVVFFSKSGGGSLGFCFTDVCGSGTNLISLYGAQLYSGSEFSPTLVAGSYAVTGGQFEGYNSSQLASVSNIVIAPQAVSVTPEPSSFVLLGTGVLCAIGTVRRKLTW